ncbi:hypothetical protein [Microbulbifer sp. TRSA005]|uniref:hypothetical protein n=1 Tax=Microbulbifer sp. TRSA005 TaxID=3243383 RepID=UPI00403A6A42
MVRILYISTKIILQLGFRAWLPFRTLGIEFKEQGIDIYKPLLFENLRRIGEMSPAALVAMLVENQSVIFDSMDIMEYVNEIGGRHLLP